MPGRPWQVRQTALEIDLGLLRENFKRLAARAKGAEVLALLKSDAYGHGHREVSLALESSPDASRLHGFGVANVEEGIEVRRNGVKRPIYVLSGIQRYDLVLHRCLETCNLTPVIGSLPVLKQLAATLEEHGGQQSIHLKVNSGMNRLGLDSRELEQATEILRGSPAIKVEGVLSHFASAEKPKHPRTLGQIKNFRAAVAQLRQAGISPRYVHMVNSSGLATGLFPEGNLARAGLHLYGLDDKELKPVARWTAQIYQVRELKKGDAVGYGGRFTAKKKTRMAVLGVGYADGYRRGLSNKAEVLLRGKRCRVIGSISMDLTAIDVSGVPTFSADDRVVLLGADGKDRITALELADHLKTISWEILTGISPRVPRVFLNG
jgi:alanine racemase